MKDEDEAITFILHPLVLTLPYPRPPLIGGFDNRSLNWNDKKSVPCVAGTSCRPGTSQFRELAVNDDAKLIEQTLAGQSDAFGQLVLKYQDRLYNTVFHALGNAEDARDVVQDAFVQAFLKLETFQHASAVLYMVVSDCI